MAENESNVQVSLQVDAEPSSRFSNFKLSRINRLARKKDRALLRDLGGMDGVMRALETSKDDGIPGNDNDIAARKKFFKTSSNAGPEEDRVSAAFICAQEAIKDPLISILAIYILVFLGFGIKDHGIKGAVLSERGTHLVEIVALLIVISMMNFWPVKLTRPDLSAYSPQTDVVRNGARMKVLIDKVVVGDIVFLKPGDKVPADGLFIDGNLLRLEKMITKRSRVPEHADIGLDNPFIFSGNMVSAGHSTMVVTAIKNQKPKGQKQVKWIKGRHADELKKLASTLTSVGRYFAWLLFMWFLFCFAVEENQAEIRDKKSDISELAIALVGILATCAIIALTSNLEGLALAVKVTLTNSMQSLMKDQALVKKLALCHQVASVDTICFNNNGTLTSDDSEVKEVWIGFSSNEEALCNPIPADLLGLLHQSTALNTGQPESRMSSTEKTMSEWAIDKLGLNTESLISSCSILEMEPFNPVTRRSGVMISKNNAIQVHIKGAVDVIIPMCSHYYESNGFIYLLNEKRRDSLKQLVQGMEEKGLRCIAFAHKKATSAEDFGNSSHQELTLLGLVGFETNVRNGFKKFVKDCQRAGIRSRLLTGDSVLTARSLAVRGGLLNKDDIQTGYIVEGEEFRNYTAEERMENVDQIRVLANATPSDKLLMVETLKKKRRVVAYVGGGLGDAQAMKAADVGICFGTRGRAEILKACSDIVILNKSFHLIFDILKWGRGFYNSLETYLQFLLIAVYVDLLVDFVITIFPTGLTLFYAGSVISRGELPTPVFQLIWVKLIFGTVAPLSLLTKHPSDDLMIKPGRVLNEPLVTPDMQRNIISHISYQILLLMTLHFMGRSVLKLNPDEKNTAIFTTYMLCQVFTLVNAKMHDRRNNLQDIHNKKCFWGVVGLITLLQVMMVEAWKSVSGTARLDSRQWASCILMSAASIPTSLLLRYIYAMKIPYLSTKAKIE